MDIALVTGAGSGVGLEISRKLIEIGYRVYGLGGNYSETPFKHPQFHPISCDLSNREILCEKLQGILDKEGDVHCVVNNAKFYPREDLEECSAAQMELSLKINLLCPLVMAQVCAPGLKRSQGFIINISATNADHARGGVVGATSSGGLRWMAESIFESMREYGVKVCTLFPQLNHLRAEDAGRPQKGRNPHATIDPGIVAQAVVGIVTHPNGNVITEMVLRPERYREPSEPAILELPYPPPKPLPVAGREPVPKTKREDRSQADDSGPVTLEKAAKRADERSVAKAEQRAKQAENRLRSAQKRLEELEDRLAQYEPIDDEQESDDANDAPARRSPMASEFEESEAMRLAREAKEERENRKATESSEEKAGPANQPRDEQAPKPKRRRRNRRRKSASEASIGSGKMSFAPGGGTKQSFAPDTSKSQASKPSRPEPQPEKEKPQAKQAVAEVKPEPKPAKKKAAKKKIATKKAAKKATKKTSSKKTTTKKVAAKKVAKKATKKAAKKSPKV